MGYIEQSLIGGETVTYKTRLHWVVLVVPGIFAIILGLGGLGLLVRSIGELAEKSGNAQLMALLGGVGVLLGAAILGHAMWYRSSVEMAVTNKRVMMKTGLVARKTGEMMLAKVESINVDQTVMGRLLNYGTITVRGTGGTPEPFLKISHPMEFRRQVQLQLEGLQKSPASV